jgi:hypothetical protein
VGVSSNTLPYPYAPPLLLTAYKLPVESKMTSLPAPTPGGESTLKIQLPLAPGVRLKTLLAVVP